MDFHVRLTAAQPGVASFSIVSWYARCAIDPGQFAGRRRNKRNGDWLPSFEPGDFEYVKIES
jgi:hypothetical protein